MKAPVKSFSASKYKEYLDKEEMKAIESQKLDEPYWRSRRRSKVLAEIYKLACKKLGCSRHYLGEKLLQLSNSKTRAIQRVSAGEIPRYERFMLACKLAGIPKAESVALWARESIPDHFSEHKKYVGVTTKRRFLCTMDHQEDPSEHDQECIEDAYKLITRELEYKCKPLPDLPKDLSRLIR